MTDDTFTALAEPAVVVPSAPADRAARWEAAAHAAGREVDRNALAVYMAVADSEQAHWSAYETRLREQHDLDVQELNRLRARVVERGAALREAAEVAVRAARGCGDSETGQYAASVAAGIGRELRRMADEAQQPEAAEVTP